MKTLLQTTTPSKLHTLLSGYIDRGDGTVLDLKTDLIWQRVSSDKKYVWEETKEYCRSLSLAGYNDWRLPTKEELETLISKRYEPTICPVFQCYPGWYWSSTSLADYSSNAWVVHFCGGYVGFNPKGESYYVRAVRSGP